DGILLFTGRAGHLRQAFRKRRCWKGSKMRSKPVVVLWTVAAALWIPYPLLAHHSSAAFDAGKKVILKGTVKEWVYSNTHCMLLHTKRESGQMVEWLGKPQPPAAIFPVGYRRDSFKAGDQVTITVEPFKDGRPYGRIVGAVLADGKTLGPATSPPSTAAPQQP